MQEAFVPGFVNLAQGSTGGCYESRVAFAIASIISSGLVYRPCLAQTTSGQISGRVVDPAGLYLGQTNDLNALPPGTRFMAANQDPTSPASLCQIIFCVATPALEASRLRNLGGGSTYNALQVSFTRRFANGFSFGANYTWSTHRS